MIVFANDPGASHAAGWLFVAWAVFAAGLYTSWGLFRGWHGGGFKLGFLHWWKHALVVYMICLALGLIGIAFLQV